MRKKTTISNISWARIHHKKKTWRKTVSIPIISKVLPAPTSWASRVFPPKSPRAIASLWWDLSSISGFIPSKVKLLPSYSLSLIELKGRSSGFRIDILPASSHSSRNSDWCNRAGAFPGYSGGSATVLHRLPFSAPLQGALWLTAALPTRYLFVKEPPRLAGKPN